MGKRRLIAALMFAMSAPSLPLALAGCGGDDDHPHSDAGHAGSDAGPGRTDGGGTSNPDSGFRTDGGTTPDTDGGSATGGAGDTCATAVAIATPGELTGQTLDGDADDFGDGERCAGTFGLDRVYSISVPAGMRLSASVTPTAGDGFDPAINIMHDCAAATITCIAGDDHGAASVTNAVRYTNTTAAAETIFIVIDGGDEGTTGQTFTLTTAFTTPAPTMGDTCATAVSITPGTRHDTLDGYANDFTAEMGCRGVSGADRFYSVVVPAGQRLLADVAPEGDFVFDPSINLVATCSATECVASDDSGSATTINRINYINTTGASQTLLLVVDTTSSVADTFVLNVAVATPPAGDTCAMPDALTVGTHTGQTTEGFANDFTSGDGCTATGGPDRVYSISVPAGQRLTATVAPEGTGSFDPSIHIRTACDADACVSADDSGGSSDANRVTYTNSTASAATVFVVVDTSGSTGGTFTLTAAIAAPPAGDVCSSATAITAGTLPDQTTVDFGNDYGDGDGCHGTGSADRFYSISVPAGQRLRATVTPESTFDITLNALVGAACDADPRVCRIGVDAGGDGDPETVAYANTGSTAQQVFLAVEGFGTGAFSLQTEIGAIPPGDLCSNAEPLTVGTRADQTTVGYGNDYGDDSDGTCNGTGGADRLYSISVPAGQQLTLTVTPEATYDPTINLLTSETCDAVLRTCIDSIDDGGDGDAETLTYINDTASAQTILVAIEGFGSTGGTYSLTAALAAAP